MSLILTTLQNAFFGTMITTSCQKRGRIKKSAKISCALRAGKQQRYQQDSSSESSIIKQLLAILSPAVLPAALEKRAVPEHMRAPKHNKIRTYDGSAERERA